MKFIDLELSSELLAGIEKLGFETPTPVQAEVIPFLLNNRRDMVALAQTGTGKTAAFGLPVLQMLTPNKRIPQALILCPTRELCMQITRDLQSFSSFLPEVKSVAVYGGADIRQQLTAIERGVQIVVATPGRMLDIIRRKRIDFSAIERVVLDEADEMLNMGFEEDLEGILSVVPAEAQKLLFSATMPKEVARIAKKYMADSHEITLGSRNAGADNISHEFYVVHAKDRYRALRRMVDIYPRMYGIVFCRTRLETQQVADHLRKDGYNAEPLHGDLTQQQRDSVMKKFREHHVQMLVATDVAARGLDVTDLTHVINYNLPDDLSVYTHRSGRTGRAGKEGIAVSIIHMREHYKINQLQKALGQKFTQRMVPTGEEIARVRLLAMAERVRDWDSDAGLIDPHLDAINEVLADLSREELLKRFCAIDMHRVLLFYRDAPDLNVEETGRQSRDASHAYGSDSSGRTSGREKRERHEPRKMTDGMVELVMNVGSVNGLTPKKLMSMVNVADRDSSVDIGRINIVKMQSYFEVPGGVAQSVIASFEKNLVDCDGRRVAVAKAGNSRPRATSDRYKERRGGQGRSSGDRREAPKRRGRGQGGPGKRRD